MLGPSLGVKFLLCHFKLTPLTRDVTCAVTLLGQKIYEEAMSDEHPPKTLSSDLQNR